MNVSGLYERTQSNDIPFSSETVRLDVDGDFPQLAASGTGTAGLAFRTHWVAQPLTRNSDPAVHEWSGPIIHKFGNTNLLPHDFVVLKVDGGQLEATFQRTGMPDRVRSFGFQSPRFRDVSLEFDAEQGVDLQLDYQTHSHPDRPATLANETLTIDTVFERAGFNVIRTAQDTVVPSHLSGLNSRWSDNEMHDAMQVHFSILASLPEWQRNRARWALWTFFAGLHERGTGLGGIVFDTIGTAERQGTAIFMNSFIANAPFGDPAPNAWVQRMAFWTAVHEMGHGFNLYHAWIKNLDPQWVPQMASANLLTFMNYPFYYQTGPTQHGPTQNANTIRFFDDFGFRFTDEELLFLRHAPEDFVIMGGSRFGVDHAFEQANLSPAPGLQLELRVNRAESVFKFMEPVVLEMKLKNVSNHPAMIPEHILRMGDQLTIRIQKRGEAPKSFHPFAHYCFDAANRVLPAGESMYESLFLSVGQDGWMIDAPGYYTIQVCLHLGGEDVLSAPLVIRVVPPNSRDEEYLAQDYFSEDVGRVLTFDGSQYLEAANDTLREVAARLPDTDAAIHAQIALCLPGTVPYKRLQPGDAKAGQKYSLTETPAKQEDLNGVAKLLGDTKGAEKVARTLGHIDYHYYADRCANALGLDGRDADASKVQSCLLETLEQKGVSENVLQSIKSEQGESGSSKPRSRKSGRKK